MPKSRSNKSGRDQSPYLMNAWEKGERTDEARATHFTNGLHEESVAQRLLKKMHPDDARMAMREATPGGSLMSAPIMRGAKQVAGKSGDYTTEPGGKVKNSKKAKK